MRNKRSHYGRRQYCAPACWFIFVVCAWFIVTGCDTSSPAPQPQKGAWRIVSSLPSKGESARESRLIRQAIDLALEETQSGSAIAVDHMTLDGGDSESGSTGPLTEAKNARVAVADSSVVAYIGPFTSSATGASLPITSKAGLLQIGVTATWPGLTMEGWDPGEPSKYYPEGQRNYVRLNAHDGWQGRAAARWAMELRLDTALALEDGSSYSQGIAREFIAAAQALGIKAEARPVPLQDFTSNPRPRTPAAVFFAASTSGNAATSLSARRKSAPLADLFMSDTTLSPAFLEGLTGDEPRVRILYNGLESLPDRESAALFSQSFRARYSELPTPAAARAYDSTKLVLGALNNASGDARKTVLETVRETRDYLGASGVITFDVAGDVLGAKLTGYAPTDGQFTLQRAFDLP